METNRNQSGGRHVVVAVTGASGAIYSMRLLKACLERGIDVDLIVSDYGKRLLIEECDLNLKTDTVESWLVAAYGPLDLPGKVTPFGAHDLGASIASGSVERDGMVVVPCSMKTLSGIAAGTSSNLIERAADVTLKEGRKLVVVPRETPLNLIHLRNMTRAAEAGAAIVPAMPAFYQNPADFNELADFLVSRILSLLSIPNRLIPPWKDGGE
jgi:4-hydroxy-3-polyprenylbenzoate decarboxylase